MKSFVLPPLAALLVGGAIAAGSQSGGSDRGLATNGWIDAYRETANRIIQTSLSSSFAWNRLAELTDSYGPRLSGSRNLERAIDWAVEGMREDGFENVRAEPVTVPQWIRGSEEASLVVPLRRQLPMLGLGGSVATPAGGIEADVIVVRSFSELEARHDARGKIVVFNAPFVTYDETVTYRVTGPSLAGRQGALAVLIRSVGPPGLRTPHTGALQYADGAARIPAAAITIEDADLMQRLQDRGERIVARLKMEGHFGPDAMSANVVGELVGRERPDEIVLVGGHLDSWDVGTGASDDAVGCIVTWEAARLLKALEIRPRRTIRVVLFTNEENGLRGAIAYRDAYRDRARDHVLAVESDSGVFSPLRLGFSGPERARATIETVGSLLGGLGLQSIRAGGGGADIGPIVQLGRIPALSIHGDTSRYFTIHHTEADTVDRLAATEVSRAAAALGVMIYVVAEMPGRLNE